MDPLDRTFRHLLQVIQARYPTHLSQPFEVAELYQNIMPYRHHRRELGLETNQDYEMVLLQLLAGARDYFVVSDEMRQRLSQELAQPNPDPGAFREFSTAQIALSPAAVRRFQDGGVAEAEPALAGAAVAAASEAPPRAASSRSSSSSPGASAQRSSSSATTAPMAAAQPTPRRAAASSVSSAPRAAASPVVARPTQTIVPQAGEQCRYCNGALPAGRRITFCPHCGQNLTVINCLACGTELEIGWKFCTTCGRPAGSA